VIVWLKGNVDNAGFRRGIIPLSEPLFVFLSFFLFLVVSTDGLYVGRGALGLDIAGLYDGRGALGLDVTWVNPDTCAVRILPVVGIIQRNKEGEDREREENAR